MDRMQHEHIVAHWTAQYRTRDERTVSRRTIHRGPHLCSCLRSQRNRRGIGFDHFNDQSIGLGDYQSHRWCLDACYPSINGIESRFLGLFHNDIQRLEKLIGRDLEAWLE